MHMAHAVQDNEARQPDVHGQNGKGLIHTCLVNIAASEPVSVMM